MVSFPRVPQGLPGFIFRIPLVEFAFARCCGRKACACRCWTEHALYSTTLTIAFIVLGPDHLWSPLKSCVCGIFFDEDRKTVDLHSDRDWRTETSYCEMATLHAHPALQPMSVGRGREDPSSPAPSDADMLPPNRDISSSRHRAIEPSVQRAYAQPSPSSSSGGASPSSRDVPELGPARAFLMPMRHKPVPALSNLLLHSSYELGAPLSDIGEEETSPRLRRARSRSPSPPTTGSSTTGHQSPASWSRKSEKRLSEMSSSSSISLGSDLQWDGFDTRYGMSDRLRADLAAAGDDNSSVDGLASKRDSATMYGDEETTTQALSSRAEQILANAKKRLTVCFPQASGLYGPDLTCFSEYGRQPEQSSDIFAGDARRESILRRK